MTRQASPASRAARSALATALLALPLAGCGGGNGLEPQVYAVRHLPNGSNAQAGSIAIRNLRLLPPADGEYTAGEDARAAMVLVNSGDEADALIGASSPSATSVAITHAGAAATEILVAAKRTADEDHLLVLRGLRADLRPGSYVQLELVFRTAGSTSVLVPVETTDVPEPRRTDFHLPPVDSEGRPITEHGSEEGVGEGGRGNQEAETAGTEEQH